MRYPCLVLDHDDTVVNSTATIHYPCFVEYTASRFPEQHYTLQDYLRYNFDPGVIPFFRDIVGMSEEMMLDEQAYWNRYVKSHVPTAYEGMKELLWKYKSMGGVICVVSHSYTENILRDYRMNDLPEPDLVFGWECVPERRKPNKYPLEKIMEVFHFVPDQLLMVDDLKPGYDMAQACGVHFAGAGWADDIPQEIRDFMLKNCSLYFDRISDFSGYLL